MTGINEWDDAATAWDEGREFVETMKAELGAGTGELAARLADAVSPDGRVLATDLAPGMVELIERLAVERPQLSAAVSDAAATGLGNESFDAAASRMLLMLLPDPQAALTDWHRVLRPGGRLAVAVWDAPEHNTWLLALGLSAMIHGAVSGGPPTGPGGVFSLSSVEALSAVATSAGFTSVDVRPITMQARFANAEDHFATVSATAAPLRKALAEATPETLEKIKTTTAEIIAPHQTEDGYVIPAQALLCTAIA